MILQYNRNKSSVDWSRTVSAILSYTTPNEAVSKQEVMRKVHLMCLYPTI